MSDHDDAHNLPPGWIMKRDSAASKPYFVYASTGEMTWDDPRIHDQVELIEADDVHKPGAAVGGVKVNAMASSAAPVHQHEHGAFAQQQMAMPDVKRPHGPRTYFPESSYSTAPSQQADQPSTVATSQSAFPQPATLLQSPPTTMPTAARVDPSMEAYDSSLHCRPQQLQSMPSLPPPQRTNSQNVISTSAQPPIEAWKHPHQPNASSETEHNSWMHPGHNPSLPQPMHSQGTFAAAATAPPSAETLAHGQQPQYSGAIGSSFNPTGYHGYRYPAATQSSLSAPAPPAQSSAPPPYTYSAPMQPPQPTYPQVLGQHAQSGFLPPPQTNTQPSTLHHSTTSSSVVDAQPLHSNNWQTGAAVLPATPQAYNQQQYFHPMTAPPIGGQYHSASPHTQPGQGYGGGYVAAPPCGYYATNQYHYQPQAHAQSNQSGPSPFGKLPVNSITGAVGMAAGMASGVVSSLIGKKVKLGNFK